MQGTYKGRAAREHERSCGWLNVREQSVGVTDLATQQQVRKIDLSVVLGVGVANVHAS